MFVANTARKLSSSSSLKLRKLLNFHVENETWLRFAHNDSGGDGDDEDEMPCGSFYKYLIFFNTYYLPFIIFVGLIGNLLSCVVFLTTYLKMRSSSYYLTALAVADFVFLSVLLVVHCSYTNFIEIYNLEGWCQVFVYISSVTSTLSVWLIVAFTVERFIAVQYPLQRPHMCTVTRAKIIVVLLTVLAMLSHCYVFWTAGLQKRDDFSPQECDIVPDYFDFMKVINFMDSIFTLIGPLILIVMMNTMIARNLYHFSKRIQSGSMNECLSNGHWMEQKNLTQTASSNRRRGSHSNSHKSTTSKTVRKQMYNQIEQLPTTNVKSPGLMSMKTQQSISKMLLLISSVFIVLNFPSYAIRLYVYFVYMFWEENPPEILWCMQQFAMMLFYTNYSVNFSLYAMYGITFRRCLWQLIRNVLKKMTRKPCRVQ